MNAKKGQRQHYVPQFLLRNWMGPDCKVGSFRKDLPGMPYSRLSPRATGYEEGVYSLKGVPEEDINAVKRKFLGRLIAVVLRRLTRYLTLDFPRLIPKTCTGCLLSWRL